MSREEQFRDAVVRNFAAELADPPLELCPLCCDGWIQPNTAAGKLGICPSCWNRKLAEAQRLAQRELESAREYEGERARLYRMRKKAKGAR